MTSPNFCVSVKDVCHIKETLYEKGTWERNIRINGAVGKKNSSKRFLGTVGTSYTLNIIHVWFCCFDQQVFFIQRSANINSLRVNIEICMSIIRVRINASREVVKVLIESMYIGFNLAKIYKLRSISKLGSWRINRVSKSGLETLNDLNAYFSKPYGLSPSIGSPNQV